MLRFGFGFGLIRRDANLVRMSSNLQPANKTGHWWIIHLIFPVWRTWIAYWEWWRSCKIFTVSDGSESDTQHYMLNLIMFLCRFKNFCYIGCPDSTYSRDSIMTCLPCKSSCLSCTEDECIYCEEGFYLKGNVLYHHLPQHLVTQYWLYMNTFWCHIRHNSVLCVCLCTK